MNDEELDRHLQRMDRLLTDVYEGVKGRLNDHQAAMTKELLDVGE